MTALQPAGQLLGRRHQLVFLLAPALLHRLEAAPLERQRLQREAAEQQQQGHSHRQRQHDSVQQPGSGLPPPKHQ
jgi:hypothetical protein